MPSIALLRQGGGALGAYELGQTLNPSLPANSARRKLSGFKDMVKLRMVERPLVISNEQAQQDPPEDMGGTLDFSTQTITRRVAAGYRDAKRVWGPV